MAIGHRSVLCCFELCRTVHPAAGFTFVIPGCSGSISSASCTGSRMMLRPYKIVDVAPSISTISTIHPYLHMSSIFHHTHSLNFTPACVLITACTATHQNTCNVGPALFRLFTKNHYSAGEGDTRGLQRQDESPTIMRRTFRWTHHVYWPRSRVLVMRTHR